MMRHAQRLRSMGLLDPDSEVEIHRKNPLLRHPDFTYNQDTRILQGSAGLRQLTPSLGEALSYFCKHPNEVVSNGRILGELYGFDREGMRGNGLVKTMVYDIRDHLGEVGVIEPHKVLVSRRSIGYELVDTSQKKEEDTVYQHPDFDFDFSRGLLTFEEGQTARLSIMQSNLLKRLIDHVNQVVSSPNLFKDLRGGEGTSMDALKAHMSRIMKTIANGRLLEDPVIVSLYGRGYMLLDFSKLSESEAEYYRTHVDNTKRRLIK
ncbi:MAG: winged helix-turn-helix domain-containing protein [Candidatus Levyibacteriota bacterium]